MTSYAKLWPSTVRRPWSATQVPVTRLLAVLTHTIQCSIGSASIDWLEVAGNVDGRNNKDCRKRWVYAFQTETKKGPWARDEDERLEAGVQQHGCK